MPSENKPPVDDKPKSIAEQKAENKARRDAMAKQFEEDRERRFDHARNQEEEEPPEDTPKPKPQSEEEPPEEEESHLKEEDEPEKPDDSKDDDEDDDDFDDFEDEEETPPDDDEPDDEDPLEEKEGSDDDVPQNIKTIRAKLKEEGGKRKAAEARTIELEEELERLREEKRELEERNKDIAANQINWNSHEQVTPLLDKFDEIVNNGASTFSDADSAKRFRKDSQSVLLQQYYDLRKGAKTADDRLEADIKFKTELADRYDVDDATPLVNTVRDAMNQYIEIQDTIEELKQKHEEGRLSVGVRAYHEGVKPFEDLFEDLGNVEEDYIENNPQSVEAVVGKKFAEDKEFRSKAEKHKDRIKQFIFGLRPLTQEELNKAEARASTKGVSLKEYLQNREANYEASRRKFLNDVFYSGMAMEEFGEMRKIYDRYQKSKHKRDNARRSLAKATSKDTSKAKPKEDKPIRAKDREWIPPSQRKFD